MFPFKFEKALQAVGILLRGEPSRETNYMRLLKLLYIADRESLGDTGRPIAGGRVVAMARGPVPSHLYDIIKGADVHYADWDRFIKRRGYRVQLIREPGIGELCKYEIEKLTEVSERYRLKDEWDMVQETHQFPEWKRNDPGSSSRPIPLADILDAVGRAEDARSIEQDARADAAFAKAFEAPGSC